MLIYDKDGNQTLVTNRYSNLRIEKEINISDTAFFNTPLRMGLHLEPEGYFEIPAGRFVIKEKNLSGDGFEIVGKYDLEDFLSAMEPKTYTTKSISYMLTDLLGPLGWTVNNQATETINRTVTGSNIVIIEMLYQIIDAFKYEIEFDNVNKIVTVDKELGTNKGTYFHNELNLKDLSIKSDTYDLITRLIPRGLDDMGIETVNGGVPYVDNLNYTNKIIVGYWSDERYQNKQNLKDEAIKKLETLSKPLRSFEVDVLDLTKKQEYKDLTFEKGDTIELIDNITKTRELQRIVKKVIFPEEFGQDKITIENRPRYLNEEQDKIIQDLRANFKITKASLELFEDSISGRVESLEVTLENINLIEESNTPPENPETGDLWLQGTVLRKWDGEQWLEIGNNIIDSQTEPVDPVEGTLWLKDGVLKRYNGTQWVNIGVNIQDTAEAPTDPLVGDLWVKDGILRRWDGTEWVEIGKDDEDIYQRIRENKSAIDLFDDRFELVISKTEFNDYKDGTSQAISDLESSFIATAEAWELQFSQTAGSNFVRNSAGLSYTYIEETPLVDEEYIFDYWTTFGYVSSVQNEGLEGISSGSTFEVNGSMAQIVTLEPNKEYTLSFKVRNMMTDSSSGVFVMISDIIDGVEVDNSSGSYYIQDDKNFENKKLTFTTTSSTVRLYFEVDTGYLQITNITVNEGSIAHIWTPYPKELYTTNFRSDERGFRVSQMEDGRVIGFTEMTPTEFAGYYNDVKVFKMNKDIFEMSNAKVENEIQLGNYRFVAMGNGIGIVPVAE